MAKGKEKANNIVNANSKVNSASKSSLKSSDKISQDTQSQPLQTSTPKETERSTDQVTNPPDSAQETKTELNVSAIALTLLKVLGIFIVALLLICIFVAVLFMFKPKTAYIKASFPLSEFEIKDIAAEEIKQTWNDDSFNLYDIHSVNCFAIDLNELEINNVPYNSGSYLIIEPETPNENSTSSILVAGAIYENYIYQPRVDELSNNSHLLNPYYRYPYYTNDAFLNYQAIESIRSALDKSLITLGTEAYIFAKDTIIFDLGDNTKAYIYQSSTDTLEELKTDKGVISAKPKEDLPNKSVGANTDALPSNTDLSYCIKIVKQSDLPESLTASKKFDEKILFVYEDDICTESNSVTKCTLSGCDKLLFEYGHGNSTNYTVQGQSISLKAVENGYISIHKDDNAIVVSGYVSQANLGTNNLFPNIRDWYFSNVLLAPFTLLGVVISFVTLLNTLMKKKN